MQVLGVIAVLAIFGTLVAVLWQVVVTVGELVLADMRSTVGGVLRTLAWALVLRLVP